MDEKNEKTCQGTIYNMINCDLIGNKYENCHDCPFREEDEEDEEDEEYEDDDEYD